MYNIWNAYELTNFKTKGLNFDLEAINFLIHTYDYLLENTFGFV